MRINSQYTSIIPSLPFSTAIFASVFVFEAIVSEQEREESERRREAKQLRGYWLNATRAKDVCITCTVSRSLSGRLGYSRTLVSDIAELILALSTCNLCGAPHSTPWLSREHSIAPPA